MIRNKFSAFKFYTLLVLAIPTAPFFPNQLNVIASESPQFASPLPANLVLTVNAPLTIGIDVDDPDSSNVTVSAVSDNPGVQITIPSGNRFGQLRFNDADGDPLGTVLVELFETRGGLATQRFIDLSTKNFDQNMDEISGDPFYTNVAVHRVIPGFIIQSGDATLGNGSGGSNLGEFPDQFSLQEGLGFTAEGVLAMAHSGPDTNDSQFFITEGPATHLNGVHMIFGHVVSGQNVVNTIANLPRDSNNRPLQLPRLASILIVDNTQDATVSFKSVNGFVGEANVTITLLDSDGDQTQQTVKVAVLGFDDPDITLAPGNSTDFTTDPHGNAAQSQTVSVSNAPSGPTVDHNTGTNKIDVSIPADFSGILGITMAATQDNQPLLSGTHQVLVTAQNDGDLPIISRIPTNPTGSALSQTLDGNLLYVANDQRGLEVFDISNPAMPQFMGGFNTGGRSQAISVFTYGIQRKVAFLADTKGGLLVLDATNPGNIIQIDRIKIDPPVGNPDGSNILDVAVEQNNATVFAYLAANLAGLVIFDVTDPDSIGAPLSTLPFDQGSGPFPFSAVAIKGNTAYVAVAINAFLVADVSDRSSPGFIDSIIVSGAQFSAPFLVGNQLFFTDSGTASRLAIYDITNPNNAIETGSFTLENSPSQVTADGTIAVVGHATGGFSFIDVRNPVAPALDFFLHTPFGATPIIDGKRFILPIRNHGVLLVDGHQLTEPEISVMLGNENVIDGNETPIDFGPVLQGDAEPVFSFTVHNRGHGALTLGALTVPSGFRITESLTSSLDTGEMDTFSIALQTDTVGTKSGEITFTATNDADENPFNFAVEGSVSNSSITGNKWQDSNGNGTRDPGEPGIAGFTIYLDSNNNGTRDTTEPNEPFRTTADDNPATGDIDETGDYGFLGLLPGDYVIREEATADFVQTFPEPEDFYTMSLVPGISATNIDFGNQPLPSSIGGIVWLDQDGNDTKGPNEPGIAGIQVFLDSQTDNNQLDDDEPLVVTSLDNPATADIDEGGIFLFSNLLPGSYDVRQKPPSGITRVIPASGSYNVELQANTTVDNQNFRNQMTLADVGGATTLNSTGNGIDGVSVFLYLSDGDTEFEGGGDDRPVGVQSTVNGIYDFRFLAPGDYWIDVNERSLVLLGTGLISGMNPRLVSLIANDDLDDKNFIFDTLAVTSVTFDLERGWNLISLPIEPLVSTGNSLFSQTAGPARAALIGNIWEWINDGTSRRFQTVEAIKPLVGYWIFAIDAVSLSVDGYEMVNPRRTLYKGWNLIGPGLAEGSQMSIPVHEKLQGSIWSWSRARFENQTILKSKGGYWMNASDVVNLLLGL